MSTPGNPIESVASAALEEAAGAVSQAQHVLASLADGVVLIDDAGRIVLANPACARMLSVELRRGNRVLDALAVESDLSDMFRRALAGERLSDEDIQFYPLPPAPAGAATTHRTTWLRVNSMHLADDDSASLGTLLTLAEVTDLKRAERTVWQSEKMTALGRLAASVAHEVGNPLGAIDIQLQLLQEDVEKAGVEVRERASRRINIARAEMRRLNGIVQNFLRFSRPPALHLADLSPNDLLRHTHALVAPEAREREIELVLETMDDLPPITVDENQLSQAVLNVLINAFQAGGDNPKVTLSSRLADDGDTVLLEISDNGVGIAEENLERIFEFYYTTKDSGTGLGLSIAQRIVNQHGGAVELDSAAGHGTTVTFRLPHAGS